jgi:hypothetical protein
VDEKEQDPYSCSDVASKASLASGMHVDGFLLGNPINGGHHPLQTHLKQSVCSDVLVSFVVSEVYQ